MKGLFNAKRTVNMVSDLQRVSEATARIQEMMDLVMNYVDDVIVSINFLYMYVHKIACFRKGNANSFTDM